MKRYRFYVGTTVDGTKNHTVIDVQRYCTANLRGFTVYTASGVWNRNSEYTAVIEIMGSPMDRRDGFIIEPETLARLLKTHFKQDAVMMTSETVKVNFI